MNKKLGFTLVELAVSLGIAGSLSLIGLQESSFEATQDKARALGNEIFLYNSGVSRFLAANAGDSTLDGEIKTGSSWLKSDDCPDGEAAESYLGCDIMPNGSTIQHVIMPTTTFEYSDSGDLTARTTWETVIGGSGNADGMGMGIAALVASGQSISQHNDAASGYLASNVYCPDTATVSPSIASICGSDRNKIISISGVASSVEPWLRTDHGNTMRNVIEFNPDGDRSTEAELRDVEDRTGGSWLRQIVNVSRIYNGIGGSGDSIAIGARSGSSIVSDSFITSNGLLQGAVIMDGDAGVMNDFYVKASAYVSDSLEVTNTILSGGDITSGSNIQAAVNVQAGNDVIAGRDAVARRFVDADNSSFYVDPASTSIIRDVEARDINARDVEGRIFRDSADPSRYRVQPSNYSRINNLRTDGYINSHGSIRARDTLRVDGNHTAYGRINVRGDGIRLLNSTSGISPGNRCSPNGMLARSSSSGQLVNCVSGRWVSAGGVSATTPYNVSRSGTNNTGNPMYIWGYSIYQRWGMNRLRVCGRAVDRNYISSGSGSWPVTSRVSGIVPNGCTWEIERDGRNHQTTRVRALEIR